MVNGDLLIPADWIKKPVTGINSFAERQPPSCRERENWKLICIAYSFYVFYFYPPWYVLRSGSEKR